MSKKGLGRGLQALIPTSDNLNQENEEALQGNGVVEIPIKKIKPNKKQPRRVFDEDKLEELAQSIKEYGVVQPIIVRQTDEGYEIVAGERRWRACQKLGLPTVPAIIKRFDDRELTEIALIENIQRENLNPIEEALAYRRLIKDFGLTQEQLSQRLAKSRSFIANIMRLLNLPTPIQEMVEVGKLTIGHARALLSLEDDEKQNNLAERIIRDGLTVRDVEKAVNASTNSQKIKRKGTNQGAVEPIYQQIEEKMRELLGTQVKIKNQGEKGKIEIDYYNEDDLNRIIERLFGEDQF